MQMMLTEVVRVLTDIQSLVDVPQRLSQQENAKVYVLDQLCKDSLSLSIAPTALIHICSPYMHQHGGHIVSSSCEWSYVSTGWKT